MNKRIRQYAGLLSAVLAYYLVHEGAHLVYALASGVFQRINFMGLGVQIAVASERMNHLQLGIFCLVGAAATAITAYILTLAAPQICRARSKVFRACMYDITIAMLLIDPLYLSALCGLFGGGDMNGIARLLPEWLARLCFGVLLALHCLLFWKAVLPKYKESFAEKGTASGSPVQWETVQALSVRLCSCRQEADEGIENRRFLQAAKEAALKRPESDERLVKSSLSFFSAKTRMVLDFSGIIIRENLKN